MIREIRYERDEESGASNRWERDDQNRREMARWYEREIMSARETRRRLEKEDFVHCRRKREGTSANIGGVSWKSEREGIIVSETGWWFQSPPDPRRARFSNGCSSHPRRENRRLTRSFKEWATPCVYRLFVSTISIPKFRYTRSSREINETCSLFCSMIVLLLCWKVVRKKWCDNPSLRFVVFFKTVSTKHSFQLVYTYFSIQRRFILLVINVSSDVVCNVKFN